MSFLACPSSQPLSLPTQSRDDLAAEDRSLSTPSPAQEKFLAAAVEALVAAIGSQGDPRAAKVTFDAITNTARLLAMLATDLPPVPEVGVDSDGDIAVDWDFGPRRVFSVRVGKGGRIHYAGLFGHATFHGSEDLRAWVPWDIQRGIDRVLGQPPV